MDGKSLRPILTPKEATPATYRQVAEQAAGKEAGKEAAAVPAAAVQVHSGGAYLITYLATSKTPKNAQHGHYKDTSNNTFIGLRIKNETHDLAFFSFTDVFLDYDFKAPYMCELYDLAKDPFQLTNLCHGSTPDKMIPALSAQLATQWACNTAEGRPCN